MQPIDHEDPRPPYVQVAAAIRAEILSGHLGPDDHLPAARDLAQTFGVSRGVIGSAIRMLQGEGYVRSVKGGKVHVTGGARVSAVVDAQAEPPHALAPVAAFLHEAGHLKMTPRAGWLLLGIRHPESVAEHSFRVGVVGMVVAALEGANADRVAALCLLHDVHEARIGDVPSVGRPYVDTRAPEAVTLDQTAGMPIPIATMLQGLTIEYEAGKGERSLESRVAHDADRLEMLLQAREYAAQGYDTTGWVNSALTALRTESGKELGAAILAGDPHAWWETFKTSYHELRAASRARQGRPAED